MNVGDIVMQGDRVIELRKGGKSRPTSKMLGIVIAIHEVPIHMKTSRNGNWTKLLGSNTVDVLWSNGRLMKNWAENSLEIVE